MLLVLVAVCILILKLQLWSCFSTWTGWKTAKYSCAI